MAGLGIFLGLVNRVTKGSSCHSAYRMAEDTFASYQSLKDMG